MLVTEFGRVTHVNPYKQKLRQHLEQCRQNAPAMFKIKMLTKKCLAGCHLSPNLPPQDTSNSPLDILLAVVLCTACPQSYRYSCTRLLAKGLLTHDSCCWGEYANRRYQVKSLTSTAVRTC